MRVRRFFPTQWTVIAYARLSDEEMAQPDSESNQIIEGQVRYLEAYIETMKARGEIVIRQTVVRDNDLPGEGRSAFQEVIALLREKEYNCLLVSDLSRGFRNIADQTYYLEEYFPLYGIRFISTPPQYIDSYLLPGSEMDRGIKTPGSIGEQLALNASVRIRDRLDRKRTAGEFIGAFAPYGYEKHPDNSDLLVVDDMAARVIRDIFEWYTREQLSLGAIVRRLNELRIPNPTKYKNLKGQNLKSPQGNDGLWSASSVRRVLTNEVYLGKMVQGREEIINYKIQKTRKVPKEDWYVVEGTHRPIVDAATFERARQLLARYALTGTRGNVHPLGGLLKCGECKKAMSRKTSRGNSYYCCRTYREKGKQFCGSHTIREDVLFDTVLEAINLQILQLGDMQDLIRRIDETPGNSQDAGHIERALSRAKRELDNEWTVSDQTYIDMAKGNISKEQYRRLSTLYEKRQTQLRELIEALSRENERLSHAGKMRPASLALFQKNNRLTELTRRLVCDLIESVYIYSDYSVEIIFRFANPMENEPYSRK